MSETRWPERAWLFDPLDELEPFRSLCAAVRSGELALATGLDETQRLHMLAGLARRTGQKMLVVTASDPSAQRAADDLGAMMGGRVAVLPAREVSFQRVAAASQDIAFRRIEALGLAALNELDALVAPVDALQYLLMPLDAFLAGVIELTEGMALDMNTLVRRLADDGYERVDAVEGRGQFAVRGGILDVYPVGRLSALRVEFFGDEVDSLRDFDALSQRSTERVREARLMPAREALLTPAQALEAARRLETALSAALRRADRGGAGVADRQREIEQKYGLEPWEQFEREVEDADELPSLAEMRNKPRVPVKQDSALKRQFSPLIDALREGSACPMAEALMPLIYDKPQTARDYLPNWLVVMDQPDRLRERCENRALEFEEQFKTALERETALPEQVGLITRWSEVLPALLNGRALALSPFARQIADIRPKALIHFDGLNGTGYQGNLKELSRDVRAMRKDLWRLALMAGGQRRAERLQIALEEHELSLPAPVVVPAALVPGEPVILPSGLSRGFQYPDIRFAVVSETDMYGVGRQKSRVNWHAGEKLSAFTDLSVGDYVVHEQHGIGQYMGTVRLQVDGAFGDYLHIRYQGTDKLYVPTDQLDRVQKYIGSEGEAPKINKLSGNEWQKQKSRVKAGIREIAGELVKLYAERHKAQGYAYSPDTPWQRQFEDSFEYEETPDQLTAIEEIKRDMESGAVMDRLLCGDVGYGKTEVALRAIFKAVMDGRQAALLAPTTILVEQHLATMRKRFAGMPVKVDTLSRFKTAAEQKLIVEEVKRGEIDVIVGTHRLLGKDVAYRNLGLLVIDEEQRFGVKHKELIKQLKKNVDVLTLSATPIPRTLHMSMVGIRDMSLLRTPPDERYPVQTYVLEYSDGLVRDAILREMARGGQVYVLYNRVRSIEKFYERLRSLVPEARIAVGHGQMREQALEAVMLDFYEGTFDVLLCTTIIEAGLDVPRANTLIVIDSDRFGLSQLYQLRGRVGRSNRLAYAYLTVQPGKVLTETADKRLAAIREFTEFGSGFRVAMRDLEIRGTGNLLGSEQSGHMAAVGYDLYVKMIEETVRELRGDPTQGDVVTRMEVRIDAYLPGDYVPNDQLRIDVYKRIASLDRKAAREDLIEELIDRFGEPTRPVMNLVDVAHLKGLCGRLGVDTVSLKGGQLAMRFSPNAKLDIQSLLAALSRHREELTLLAGAPTFLNFKAGARPADELIRLAVPVMEDVVDATLKEEEHVKGV